MTRTDTLHASCVLVGEAGVLIRGASGAGKSRLALDLLEAARARGLHARLVGDDRIRLAAAHGRLVARPHPAIAGLVERRGVGILERPHAPAAIVRLVVDLVPEYPPRLPDPEALEAEILRVRLPRLVSSAHDGIATIALDALRGLSVGTPR
ncbi:HPr kinase/phosphorylase [Salinarimonas chemoclinalis]|uniref:HPr kinase/phosphorylase n=1 Tax=Salinarimonas chemoclinalis TaxID=3241599 RepID=UPI0035579995